MANSLTKCQYAETCPASRDEQAIAMTGYGNAIFKA
jgi:hypothetical protein